MERTNKFAKHKNFIMRWILRSIRFVLCFCPPLFFGGFYYFNRLMNLSVFSRLLLFSENNTDLLLANTILKLKLRIQKFKSNDWIKKQLRKLKKYEIAANALLEKSEIAHLRDSYEFLCTNRKIKCKRENKTNISRDIYHIHEHMLFSWLHLLDDVFCCFACMFYCVHVFVRV